MTVFSKEAENLRMMAARLKEALEALETTAKVLDDLEHGGMSRELLEMPGAKGRMARCFQTYGPMPLSDLRKRLPEASYSTLRQYLSNNPIFVRAEHGLWNYVPDAAGKGEG